MHTVIHDTINIVSSVFCCVFILGAIATVNYALSRDKVINRTMRHQ